MTSSSLAALNLLIERATQERDRLAIELRKGEDVALRTRRQHEQLVAYRSEYMQRWGSQFGRGGAIELVHCYQSFMQRLDEALEQQQRHVDAADQGVAAVRQALLQAEVRVASVKKLVERRLAERLRIDERRDQRQTDETAQHLTLRRAGNGLALQH